MRETPNLVEFIAEKLHHRSISSQSTYSRKDPRDSSHLLASRVFCDWNKITALETLQCSLGVFVDDLSSDFQSKSNFWFPIGSQDEIIITSSLRYNRIWSLVHQVNWEILEGSSALGRKIYLLVYPIEVILIFVFRY